MENNNLILARYILKKVQIEWRFYITDLLEIKLSNNECELLSKEFNLEYKYIRFLFEYSSTEEILDELRKYGNPPQECFLTDKEIEDNVDKLISRYFTVHKNNPYKIDVVN